MNASKRVLSDEISRVIDGCRVVAAVFTTYSFDPAFFELEILPLLFESRIRGGFSHVEKVRRVQLEECLRDTTDIEVFYDRGGLVGDAGPASLDFRRIDVGRRTGVFHPKLVLVLVENRQLEDSEPTRSLIVATLSANLTRSGWWENLEAGHLEVVKAASSTNRRCTFLQDLLEAIDRVVEEARPEDGRGALGTIRRFVRDSAPQEGTWNASWRGRYYTRLFAGQTPLPEWLQDRRLGGRNWNLEVVSPFFDAHGAQALRNLIRATRPSEVRVFLPTEADGTPTVTGEQYEAVAAMAKWSRLPAGIMRAGGTTSPEGVAPRTVHAKVYRFWRRGEGDVTLVGSVNLTGAATAGRMQGISKRRSWSTQPTPVSAPSGGSSPSTILPSNSRNSCRPRREMPSGSGSPSPCGTNGSATRSSTGWMTTTTERCTSKRSRARHCTRSSSPCGESGWTAAPRPPTG